MIEQLSNLVLLLADAERLGGRVQIMDAETLILYDCMNWDCFCTDAVVVRYPEVRISVRSCRQSLSGFSVTFHAGRCLRKEAGWYLVIGLFLACCGYLLIRPPWWTSMIMRI
jgi:hypothetical protein